MLTTFSPSAPQVSVTVDRDRTQTLRVSVGDVFSTLSSYLGSTYVNQFNKFGQVFQVYAQADSQFRLQPDDLLNLYVRSQDNQMVPIGAVAHLGSEVAPSLITLYNLYPSSTIIGAPARGVSSGQALEAMEGIAKNDLAERCLLPMDRDVLSGKADRQSALLPVRTIRSAGLSLPRRSIRELDLAAWRCCRRCRWHCWGRSLR